MPNHVQIRIWIALLSLLFTMSAYSFEHRFEGSKVDLMEQVVIYPAPPISRSLIKWPDVTRYLSTQNAVDEMALEFPRYWLQFKPIVNTTGKELVTLVVHGTIVDVFEIRIYQDGRLVETLSEGYLFHRNELAYTYHLNLTPDVSYDLMGVVQGRYFTGPLKVELRNPDKYAALDEQRRNLVYICLGALLILGMYNFVLYIGIREVSYLYYSLYLFVTTVGWAAIFNVLVYHFDIYTLGWNLVPFYLGPIFNSLFLLNFLRITKDSHPRLYYPVVVLTLANVVMVCIFPFIENYLIYYSLVIYNSSIWLVLSLVAGVTRLREGFKPARFFVMGFAVVAGAGFFALLPGFGIESPFENFYLVTLVAQTIDMTLLALALADKIALMRIEKSAALKQSFEKDVQMLRVEQESNKKLQSSNQKLKEAVSIYEDLERKRKNFLLVVNHELRTPVNALLESVSEVHAGKDEAEAYSNIQYGAESLSVLLDKLSVFSELAGEHAEPVFNRVAVDRLMDKLVQIGTTLTTGKSVSVECLRGGVGDVLIDAFLLEAAIKPILDNACKYTQAGMVTLDAEYDVLTNQLRVVVEDSGDGVDQEEVSRLLSAFEQSSEGFDRNSQGLGLGLFIANSAAKSLKGVLGFSRSERLGGACVELLIPCEQLEPIGEVGGLAAEALVVEDNPINAKVLIAILGSFGVRCDLAENGQEALDAVKDKHYDVVFMDLQMPVMDGFQAAEELKNKAFPSPIIAVTANSEQEARHRCLSLGMADVLIKPVRAQDIQDSIENLGYKLPE